MPTCKECGKRYITFFHATGTNLCRRCNILKQLRAYLQSSGRVERVKAASRLFDMKDESGIEVLKDALGHEDTCMLAALAFTKRRRLSEVIPQIGEMLLRTKNAIVARNLAMFIEGLDDQRVTETFISLLRQRKSVDLDHREGERELRFVVDEADGSVVLGIAAAALGKKGDKSAIPVLEKIANDPSEPDDMPGCLKNEARRAIEAIKKRVRGART